MKRGLLGFLSNRKLMYRFLEENYGYTDIRPFCSHARFAAAMNALYLAKDTRGKEVFIKCCRYGDMCENEYHTGLAAWKELPEHFAKPLAYHVSKVFCFCSTEYVPGKDLSDMLQGGHPLTDEQKTKIAEDLYAIQQALVRANVVHRDIVLKNMLYHNGRVVLIDFQLATMRNSTKRISCYDNILKICKSRWTWKPSIKILAWDDARQFVTVMRTIGANAAHCERYQAILEKLQEAIGTHIYMHPYPGMDELQAALKTCRLRSCFHHQSKMRHRYRYILKLLEFLISQHPSASV